jgi:hypothetical protein
MNATTHPLQCFLSPHARVARVGQATPKKEEQPHTGSREIGEGVRTFNLHANFTSTSANAGSTQADKLSAREFSRPTAGVMA